MAEGKALPGVGIEEDRGGPNLEGSKQYKEWEPERFSPRSGQYPEKKARVASRFAKGSRTWTLWIVAVGLFALLAAKLCTPGTPSNSLTKKREWGGFGLDGGRSFDGDMDNDFWDLDGEAKAVIAFAPFMAGENIFFEGAAHLRPQTVPFALEQAEDFSIDRSGVPKAWAAYLREQVTDGAVPEEQEPSEGPIDLGWLSEFSIDGDVAEGSDPARLRISSADAMKVARGISERYFGAAPVEEQKQSPEALANAHFSRLIGRLGSGLVTVVTEANRLPKMKFDARSRNLRSELALLEIGNAVERFKEQQSEALKDVNEARAKLENGDDDGQAEAQAEEAILTYKSLLRSEKHLMMALVQLASRWKDETTKVLTNIASVLTSSAMEDLEQISTFEASFLNAPKLARKAYGMSDVLQRETRSKNRCRLVEDVAAKRLEYIDILMASIDTLSPEEFSQLMERQNEGLAKSRAEFLSVLMKKKQEPWVADVI